MNRTAVACMLSLLLWQPVAEAQWFRSGPPAESFWPAPDRGESFLGVYLSEVTGELTEMLNLPQERGAHVNQVITDSPAEQAGLEADDVILGWNGMPVESARQFTRMVRETPPGRDVHLSVFRKGETIERVATIGTQPHFAPPPMRRDADEEDPAWCPALPPPPRFFGWPDRFEDAAVRPTRPRLGVVMQPLTDQLAAYFGLENRSGALVSSVMEDSPAKEQGVRAGDVILSVAGKDVESPGAVQQAVAAAGSEAFDLTVMRDRTRLEIHIPTDQPDAEASAADDLPAEKEAEEVYPIDSL